MACGEIRKIVPAPRSRHPRDDASGTRHDPRNRANQLASEGYPPVAPDLLGGDGLPTCTGGGFASPIVEDHSGELRLTSVEGEGTTVVMDLPLSATGDEVVP